MIWRLFALYNSFGYYRTKVRCKNFRPVFRTNTVSNSFHVVQRYACVSICLCCYVDAAASYRREKNFLLLSLSSSLSRTPIKNAREFSITVSNAFVTFDTSGNGGGFARTVSDFPLSISSQCIKWGFDIPSNLFRVGSHIISGSYYWNRVITQTFLHIADL